MRTVTCETLTFGSGRPKICIPLMGRTCSALREELEYASALPADLYEWRADYYLGDPPEALPLLRKQTGSRPLLCTVRTFPEGGRRILTGSEYEAMVSRLIASGLCQLIDIEFTQERETVSRLLALAREHRVLSVVSQHHFDRTPSEEEILGTLREMARCGADLPKFAAMPQTTRDVLRLLSATETAARLYGPVITMSMGPLGMISRVSGSCFGSCLTFGAGKGASAPGQLDAADLELILKKLDPNG